MEEEKGKICAKLSGFVGKGTKVFLGILACLFLFFGAARAADAAVLYVAPDSGTWRVNDTVTVGVYVTSQDQAMNAADGVITFPADKLEALSLSKTGTIMNLWVQEPVFVNRTGRITFSSIVLNPGFTGRGGKIIAVTFKVKGTGTIDLVFSSGSVLANDGQGTEILDSFGNGHYTAVQGTATPSPAPAAAATMLAAPGVSSPTHPDQTKWYANNNPNFIWALPAGVTGVNVLANRSPSADPGTASDGVIGSYTYQNVDEGVWYFHVKLKNSAGWGTTGHFRFQVDTEKPEILSVKEMERTDKTEPKVQFIFDATDKISGIDHFEIKIDDGAVINWIDDGSHTFITPILAAGKHVLNVGVFDKAGNVAAYTTEFSIESIPAPKIIKYPSSIYEAMSFAVSGMAMPNSTVVISVGDNFGARTFEAKSDDFGQFKATIDTMFTAGERVMWANTVDGRGAKSADSERVKFVVIPFFLNMRYAPYLIGGLALLVLFIAVLLMYLWKKYRDLKKELIKGVQNAEGSLHKAFDQLREDIRKQIKLLEKVKSIRELTAEEDRVVRQLKKDLDVLEKILKQNIHSIGKKTKR